MWRCLFYCLVAVLMISATVLHAHAPTVVGRGQEYISECLNTFLLGDGLAAERRATLTRNLQSDWEKEDIFIYRLEGMTMDEKRVWARETAEALLHTRLGSIRRQRWMTASTPVKQGGILCVAYNLFERTLWLFARRAQGKAVQPPKPAVEGARALMDVVDDAAGAPDEALPEPEAPPPLTAAGTLDWAAWNRNQQCSTERFRLTRPSGPILIAALVCDALAELQRWLVWIHSERCYAAQRAEFVRSGRFKTVGMMLIEGTGFQQFKQSVEDGFTKPTFWNILPRKLRTVRLRGVAAGMLARASCGVEHLVVSDTKRLPNYLDSILVDPQNAQAVLDFGFCQRTRAAQNILTRFKRWRSCRVRVSGPRWESSRGFNPAVKL